jgi:hypothetical protein
MLDSMGSRAVVVSVNICQQSLEFAEIHVELTVECLVEAFGNIDSEPEVSTSEGTSCDACERERLAQRNQ